MNTKILITARNSYISVGSRKMVLVTRMIQGLPVIKAIDTLSLSYKACSIDIINLLNSAIKNAINNFNIHDINSLYIKEIRLGRAKFLKRFQPRARGRSNRILKHGSNLEIILSI
jgi:large subunit ribosomal protein L22